MKLKDIITSTVHVPKPGFGIAEGKEYSYTEKGKTYTVQVQSGWGRFYAIDYVWGNRNASPVFAKMEKLLDKVNQL